jgi:hypothetical protein
LGNSLSDEENIANDVADEDAKQKHIDIKSMRRIKSMSLSLKDHMR